MISTHGGYNNRLARIDLTNEKITYDLCDEGDISKFVGGRGLGSKYLWDVREESRDRFGVFVGPLTGTGIPLANRLTFVFHSPLTNTIAYTNTGGYAGTALKLAGFDGLTVSGRSSRPKYILVKKGEITLVGGDWLWGKRATDTMNALREKHGDVRVLSIGPAGENMVRYANVVNDSGRASGVRHGVGCLLGGMNLKAIAISSDYGLRVSVANKDRFRELLVKLNKKLQNSPLLNRDTGSFSIYGTPLAVEPLIQHEALPVKNYSCSPPYEGNLNPGISLKA